MTVLHRAMRAVLLSALVAAAIPVLAQTPAESGTTAPSDSQVRELQEQIKSLQQQLDKLNATQDPSSRRSMMEQNWRGMQDYMDRMHERWGIGAPWMMGPGTMGCPMMGGAQGGGAEWWPLPEGVTPESYREQMLDHMGRMREQMNKIAQTTDPKERQRLMEEHWRGMYQDMQTMRGMGWMWEGPMMGGGMMHGAPGRPAPSATPLPDADSPGAKLISTYCTQCHAAPPPTLHTAREWTDVTQRMHDRMSGGWGEGIKTPTQQEMETIVAYMQKHAR